MGATMEFIHEITGNIASFIAYALTASGLAIYFFKYIRKYIKIDRKLIVKAHLYSTLAISAAIAGHYYSTDKSNVYVMIGIAGFAIVALFGLSLRVKIIKSKLFKKVVIAKVTILVFVAIMTLVGHTILENERHNAQKHSMLVK